MNTINLFWITLKKKTDIPLNKIRKYSKLFILPIKDYDILIEFFFLTGISKFSKVGIFSVLNHLDDLTIDPNFSTLTGYTQDELEHYFHDFLNNAKSDKEELLQEIKLWYNGYSWDAENLVYNPFSILSFFKKGIFQNFWFETGTPGFLIDILKEKDYYEAQKER